jgi:hypothetical protein
MKKISNFLLLIIIGSVACEKGEPITNCKALVNSDTVIFIKQQPQQLFTSCNATKVAITKVADSRCPIDAICIWEGMVNAELTVNDSFVVRLVLGMQKDTTYNGHTLSIKMLEAMPYPASNKTSADTIKVLMKLQ